MSITINGSTGISGVDGSSTTPAFQGTDTNTGLFYGTDIVGISTGGSERVRVDASGNVGIGTTSPNYRLTFGGQTGATATPLALRFSNDFSNGTTAASSKIFLYNDGTTGNIYGFGVGSSADVQYHAGSTGASSGNHRWYTNDTERMRIDSSGYAQGTVNGLSAGRMLAWQYYRLNSGYAGSNATGAQSLFGVGVTLVGSTVYEFEMIFQLTRASGTTSHTIALSFGGTATLNNIGYMEQYWFNSASANSISGSSQGAFINTASSTVTTGAITTAAYITYVLKGTVSVNAGGTFIPQYTLSAAPGGAYTTAIGSYVKIAPLGASGANTNIGSWA